MQTGLSAPQNRSVRWRVLFILEPGAPLLKFDLGDMASIMVSDACVAVSDLFILNTNSRHTYSRVRKYLELFGTGQ